MRRAAAVLALAFSAACASTADQRPTAAATPPVHGITAEAVQLRTDAVTGGRVHVRITATGDAPFTVTGLALDSPGFSPLPGSALTAEFSPGRVIDLPAPYGQPVCSAGAAPAAVRLDVVRPDGSTEDLLVPLGADVLVRIHEGECAALALAEVVDVAVVGLRDDGDALAGELTLTRRGGDDPVRVTRLGRSVLVDVEVATLPLTMDGGRAATAVSFTPATCDPHVLAESKQPHRFGLLVGVGKEQPMTMDLPLDDGDRELLTRLVQRVCAARE